jgi:hypothetical protein
MTATPLAQVPAHPPEADLGEPPGPGPRATGGDDTRAATEKPALRGLFSITVAGRRMEVLPPEQIGYLVGIGLLAAIEIIDWPVAIVLAVGHTLAFRSQRAGFQKLGAAMVRA